MLVSARNLILDRSFVRRLKEDLAARFDARAAPNFHLLETGHISLYDMGGRTVDKVQTYDLPLVLKHKPDIVILELDTSDLSTTLRPDVEGSKIDDKAQVLRDHVKFALLGRVKSKTVTFCTLGILIAILTLKPQFCLNIYQLSFLTSLLYFYGSIKNFIAGIALCCPCLHINIKISANKCYP